MELLDLSPVISIVLIIIFWLYLRKHEINRILKYFLYIIVAGACLIVLFDIFFCFGGDGSFNLCGVFTLLLVLPVFVFLNFIILLIYAIKTIK